MGIPGEDLPKVSHYYTDPHPYYRRKVAVIGGAIPPPSPASISGGMGRRSP